MARDAVTARPDLFVTGAARSGTSLLDKLLSAHPDIAVLSQPLPRLYVAAKQRFLAETDPSAPPQAFPLNDLFGERFRAPDGFTGFLQTARFSPDWLIATMHAMTGFSGQYTPPTAPPEALAPKAPETLAGFVARYLRAQAPSDKRILGSKETFAEEFVPYFLQSGSRVLLMLRDPRDVVASVFGAMGQAHAGQGMPLLFVLRQWRKSVAFALNHAHHPGLRLIRYEDLVTGPEEQMAAVAAWLGCDAFPGDLSGQGLRDSSGARWLSNSSHRPVSGISTGSIGRGRAILPAPLIRAIDTLCAPELRALGYDPGAPADPGDRAAMLQELREPCAAPRPALADYVWSPAALDPELRRLAAFEQQQFDPQLHLFDRAFRHLSRPVATPRAPWRPVLGGRASALIYDLVRSARPGVFLLPGNICPEVALAVEHAGGRVRYVDIDPETYAMQTDTALQILAAAPAEISGVIYARSYGACFDVSAFFAAIKSIDPQVLTVDDRCACRPEPNGPAAGPDVVLYSTGYGKYADLGGGGYAFLAPGVAWQRHDLPFVPDHAAAVTEALKAPDGITSDEIAARWPNWLQTCVSFGAWPTFCAALMAERARIDARKARINAIYRAAIPQTAWLGGEYHDWRFCIQVQNKTALLDRIFASGAFASGHYRPTAQILGGARTPRAQALYARVVNLFNDRHATPDMAMKVAEIVRGHILDEDKNNSEARGA